MPASDFKGYLFWYCIAQSAITTAVTAGFFAYGFLMTYLRLADVDTIGRQAGALEKPLMGLGFVVCIILAVVIGSRHGMTFGKGFGGYLLGNILCAVVTYPLTSLSSEIDDPLAAFWILLILIAIYAVALTGVILYARRQARNRRRQEALIEPFA